MSLAFQKRLFPVLPDIVRHFGTPFHIYDEAGIIQTGERLKGAFHDVDGFREFFAVKALPNPRIMKIMLDLGFGFDCSSTMELELAESQPVKRHDIMFTSNNTTTSEFARALNQNALINLDDISLIDKVPFFPQTICFRYNPGRSRSGNSIIGKPHEAKYGISDKQLIPAYRAAHERGARHFGIHTMICSNQRNYRYMVETVRMLLRLCVRLHKHLNIRTEFINMGGGIGIPYRPRQHSFDVEAMAREISVILARFARNHGFQPKLFMESGRFMTGPHGVLVTTVRNRKEIYQTHVGVDACMTALMRPAMYGAYHHITALNSQGVPLQPSERPYEVVNVVGPICENCDRMATGRKLPRTQDGDLLVIQDTGAHGLAMGFNYNGRTRPKELLLTKNGSVELIRRAETNSDLWWTLLFQPTVLFPKAQTT